MLGPIVVVFIFTFNKSEIDSRVDHRLGELTSLQTHPTLTATLKGN